MRPYRGKPVSDPKGDFVKGYYLVLGAVHLIVPEDARMCFCYEMGNGGFGELDHKSNKEANYWPVEVIPKSVSQSTGLKDKNGVEIFGKDIIQLEYTSVPIFRRQVEFNKGAYGYYEPILDKPNFISLCYPCGNKMSSKSWIVIGNAVDNGELLKG